MDSENEVTDGSTTEETINGGSVESSSTKEGMGLSDVFKGGDKEELSTTSADGIVENVEFGNSCLK
jgi:hypothetical protein